MQVDLFVAGGSLSSAMTDAPRPSLVLVDENPERTDQLSAEQREFLAPPAPQDNPALAERIMGEHPAMRHVLRLVERVAPRRASVLVTGETGTGKELVARALHQQSGRSGHFVALNCAALAESVLESELFGHERGAFTGALQRRDGRFKQADHGTLFLDEVSEIPPGTQVKLLRFLQERQYERVGSNRTEQVDVRIVSACNADLAERVLLGRFREDLYYRLNVIDISIPPLRARRKDIPALARHFVSRACSEDGHTPIPALSEEALTRLLGHAWPGNVRELQNAMERAVAVCDGDLILPEHLPATLRDAPPPKDTRLAIPGMTLAELERFAVLRTLEAVHGSPAKAAQLLGVSTRTIQYRLKEWNIDRADVLQHPTGGALEDDRRPN